MSDPHITSAEALLFFRYSLGMIIAIDNWLLLKNRIYLFEAGGIFPTQFLQNKSASPTELFLYFGSSENWIRKIQWAGIICGVLLAIGLFSPLASLAAYLIYASRYNRNPYAVQGGEALIRLALIPLMFFPTLPQATADFYIPFFKNWGSHVSVVTLKIQFCVVYARSSYWKIQRPLWRQGLMLNRVLDANLARKKSPFRALLKYRISCALATWAIILTQIFVAIGMWFSPTKLASVVLSSCLQIAILLALQIGLFQPIMLCFGFLLLG